MEESTKLFTDALLSHAQYLWESENSGRHTYSVKQIRSEWSSSDQCSRHREVLLARLRLGHTYLTHKYLLSPDKIVPQCDTCSVRLTVRHIQGADDKLGRVSRRSLMDVTLCER